MANPTLSIVNGSKSAGQAPGKSQSSNIIDSLSTDQQLLLELSNKLHSTLELEKLLIVFELEIAPVLNLDNIIYHAPDNTEVIEPKGRHLVSYQLVLHNKDLGEIALLRRTRFSIKEQKFIEKILLALLSPLHNALEYTRAINASLQDPLTGTFNRFAMESIFSREIELAQRNHTPLSMIVLDIDFFKKVNDSYGHATGDCVLKHLIECIKQCTRNTDMLFRYGGEEFTLLLNSTDKPGTKLLAERIRETVEQTPCVCNGHNIAITVSMGISSFTFEDTQESFFERADKALYQAKSAGRNQVMCEVR
ncbi:MAG: GGDEF domain-containing protein [Gammaproteobacteria bacterium]|nr:GGDEF domain-containing protein [Gammaproteobacteria bacterium]